MAKKQIVQPSSQQIKRPSDEEIRARGFSPFLRPEHTVEGEIFQLTGWTNKHTDGRQIIVEVENSKGLTFSLGVRIGSPDHRVLFKALGVDWALWAGSIIVTIVDGQRNNMKFVNVHSAYAHPDHVPS